MRILEEKYLNEILSEKLKIFGFTRKGKAFFRVQGDGILQVIKFEYERVMDDYDLSIGLFSLYGELLKRWFTSSGCIPRYSIVNLINERTPVISKEINGMVYDYVISPKKQIEILIEKGIPWLNEMQTQEDLIEGIWRFDDGWNDSLKIAPFLMTNQEKKAIRVISSILQQHLPVIYQISPGREEWPEFEWEEEHIQRYENLFPGKDKEFLNLHRMINRNDEREIRAYLMKNYEQNMQYAAFCRKK